jgi:hypothetical protein
MSDGYYGTQRVGKTIKLTNVKLGGYEKLGTNEIHLWGNDGDIHWNGTYMCCRYIFKVSEADEQKINQMNGQIATVIGTLADFRDNDYTAPYTNEPVTLKEYVFENVIIELTPTTVKEEKTVVEEPIETDGKEKVDAALVNTTTGEVEEDERSIGTIISDKAFFYEDKDVTTRKKSYLIKGQRVKYFKGGTGEFTMAFYEDEKGISTSGWMLKSDMK